MIARLSLGVAVVGVLLLLLSALVRQDLVHANLGYIHLAKAGLTPRAAFAAAVQYDPPAVRQPEHLMAAQGHFAEALRRSPDLASARAGLARVSLAAGEPDQAVAAARQAAASGYGGPALGNFLLGNALIQDGQADAALTAWRAAVPLETRPHLAGLIFAQGRGTHDAERWGQAVAVLEQSLTDPALTADQAAGLQRLLSDYYTSLNEPERARHHAEQAVASQPENPALQGWLADRLYHVAGQPEEAVRVATSALAAGPDWRASAVLGQAALAECRPAEAVPHLQAALAADAQGDWRHDLVWLRLAEAHAELGDARAARAAVEEFATRQPNYHDLATLLSAARDGNLPVRCGNRAAGAG